MNDYSKLIIDMKTRYCHFLFAAFILFLGCTNKLLNPLKGSSSISKTNGDVNLIPTEIGTTIYLKPKNILKVRAIKDCVILKVLFMKDSSVSILMKGKVNAAYGNLSKSYVASGQTVKRGQKIGELYSKDSVGNNLLEISIEKGGRYLRPNW